MRSTAKWCTALAGISIWACAKANDSKLIANGDDPAGRAGAAGVSGAAARGGSSATAGTGAGGTGNRGGSAGSNGKSTGGTGGSGTGGSGAQGGTSNQGGSAGKAGGGEAGQPGIDPDVLARAKLVLHYIAQATQTNSNSVEMRLFLENKADDALPLEPVEVRYWMTAEPSQRSLNSFYAASATSNRVLRFRDDADDSYVQITFTGGQLPAHTSDLNSTEFQVKVETSSGDRFDQDDDYSFDARLTGQPAAPHDKITVYVDDRLVWGCEPSGACPDTGEGGAGGEGGAAGSSGASGEAGAAGAAGRGEGGQAGEPAANGGEGGQLGEGGAAGLVTP